MATNNPQNLIASLCLSRTDGIGPITYHRLLERFGSATAALDALPHMAAKGGKKNFSPFPRSRATDELEKLEKLGGRMLLHGTPDYPNLLAQIEDAPPIISIFGNAELLQKPCIAIVGARNASLAGQHMAQKLAADLGKAGLVIVSGLARGLDAAAHQAALATGTIGVVAGGVNVIYPPENEKLQQTLAKQGCVVAEMPYGTQPIATLFPRRNRIISGLCRATIVVEATLKSGSLITATLAADQGRDVLAVPGNPLDPRSAGPNALLKDGAIMARDAQDVLDVLAQTKHTNLNEPHHPFTANTVPADFDSTNAQSALLDALGYDPMPFDALLTALQIPANILQIAVLELEIAGRVVRYPGGRLALCAGAEVASHQSFL